MISALYVDDDTALLDIGKLFLERNREVSVDTTLSGQEALERLEAHQYDAIVSDYMMPGMDGIELLKAVRARYPGIPFIIFTGRGREEVAIEALNYGADFYLQKGGDPKAQFIELSNMVNQAVSRRRAEEKLHESERRMADIIDHLPDATFAIDLKRRVIAWNRAMEEMTGIKKEEILGTGDHSYAIPFYREKRPILLDLILGEDKETEKKYPGIVKKDDKLISEIYFPILYGGRGAYLWFVASPLYDTKGQVIGAIESIRDITDRKQMEDALLASEERYRALYHENPTMFFTLDSHGTVISVNQFGASQLGYTVAELEGQSVLKVFYEKDHRAVTEQLKTCLQSPGNARHWEFRKVRKDGSLIWVEEFARAVIDPEGGLSVFVVCQDITARKRAEEELRQNYGELSKKERALRESEQRYRNVVEDQTELISRFLPDGTHIFVNEAYCRYFSKRREEIIGKRFIPDIPEEDQALVRQHFASLTREHPVATVTHRIILPDGRIRWQQWSDRAIFDGEGNVIEYQSVGRDLTELKRVEEALREREIQLTNAMDLANLVNWEFDVDSRMFTFDDRFYRLYGTSAEREGGTLMPADTYFREFVHPDDLPTVLSVVRAIQKPADLHHTIQLEHRIIRRDGEVRDIVVRLTGIVNNEGRIVRSFGANQDITERKRAEEELRRKNEELQAAYEELTTAEEELRQNYDELSKTERDLRESERRYRDFVELLPQTVFEFNDRGIITSANHIGLKSFGYTQEDLDKGVNAFQVLVPEDRDRARKNVQRTFSGEDMGGVEYTAVRKDGSTFPVIIYSSVVMKENKPVGLRGILIDLTERKQAEGALRESEAKYRTIFENTGTATVLVEEDTIISLANAEFERLSGYSKQEIERKKSWTEFVVKEDLDRMLDQHRLRRESREAALKHYEFRFITKSGDIRNIFLTIDVIPGTKRSVASLMDITDKKLTEEALRQANKKLNLLSSITRHDILNQLVVLKGYLELSEKFVRDPAKLRESIKKEIKAAETIEEQISFTRDYQNMGVTAPAWQNVNASISRAVATLPMRNVRVDVDRTDLEVFVDPLLEKVFYNLIDNSLRHGGKKLTSVRFSSHESDDGMTVVCEDDGVGISGEAKKHLFERGFGENTGLGIYLVREILSITGLTIRETGVPGQGARFEIFVPKGTYRFM